MCFLHAALLRCFPALLLFVSSCSVTDDDTQARGLIEILPAFA
jgi:hypothetical protein